MFRLSKKILDAKTNFFEVCNHQTPLKLVLFQWNWLKNRNRLTYLTDEKNVTTKFYLIAFKCFVAFPHFSLFLFEPKKENDLFLDTLATFVEFDVVFIQYIGVNLNEETHTFIKHTQIYHLSSFGCNLDFLWYVFCKIFWRVNFCSGSSNDSRYQFLPPSSWNCMSSIWTEKRFQVFRFYVLMGVKKHFDSFLPTKTLKSNFRKLFSEISVL